MQKHEATVIVLRLRLMAILCKLLAFSKMPVRDRISISRSILHQNLIVIIPKFKLVLPRCNITYLDVITVLVFMLCSIKQQYFFLRHPVCL